MPASKPLMPQRVASTPVTEPAAAPARKAAAVASQGLTSAAMSTAAVQPPKVIEPSTVRSRNEMIRKLIKTPSANSERIRPIVRAPTKSVISGGLLAYGRHQRRQPTGAGD